MHVCCKCFLTDGLYNISSPILPEIKKEEATNPLYSDILRDYHLHPSQHSNSGPPEQWTASPGESLPPCRGLWGTLHTGDDIDCNYCLLWEC